jgi:hypothetical protein
MFNTFYLLINYAKYFNIQTMDCNDLQNSYVLRILCFWGEDDGTKHFISFEGGGGIKYFPTLFVGEGVPNFMVEFWNTFHPQYTYFMTGP